MSSGWLVGIVRVRIHVFLTVMLDLHITVSDPETFTEPATIESWWEALGDEIPVYDCQTG